MWNSIYEDLRLRHLRTISRSEMKANTICSHYVERTCRKYFKIVCEVNSKSTVLYSISEHIIIHLQLFILLDINHIFKDVMFRKQVVTYA
jgi:hypothetical protein